MTFLEINHVRDLIEEETHKSQFAAKMFFPVPLLNSQQFVFPICLLLLPSKSQQVPTRKKMIIAMHHERSALLLWLVTGTNILWIVSLFEAVRQVNHDEDVRGDVRDAGKVNLISPPRFIHFVGLATGCVVIRIVPRGIIAKFINSASYQEDAIIGSVGLAIALINLLHDLLTKSDNLHVATVLLAVLWLILLPFYTVVAFNRALPKPRDWIFVSIGEFTFRLFFCWLSGAVIFGVIDIAQYFYGAYFNSTTYTILLGVLLTFVINAYAITRDPPIGLIVTWFIVGLTNRDMMLQDDVQETFETLQLIVNVFKPVFLLLVINDSVRRMLFPWKIVALRNTFFFFSFLFFFFFAPQFKVSTDRIQNVMMRSEVNTASTRPSAWCLIPSRLPSLL